MAYLRFSNSEWYVYAHVEGGLWIGYRGDTKNAVHLSTEDVKDYLSGDKHMVDIPGWKESLPIEKRRLLWAMREYIADEQEEEINGIGYNIRQMLRKADKQLKKDKDPGALK